MYSRITELAENNAYRQSIVKYIEKLRGIADELSRMENENFPESCKEMIDSFNDAIEICKSTCKTLERAGSLRKFYDAKVHGKYLKRLETELQRASDNLQLALQMIAVAKTSQVHEAVNKGTREVKATVVHPNEGVFLPSRKSVDFRPHQIRDVNVFLESDDSGDLMVVQWKDDENCDSSIIRYEISYDEEDEQVFPTTAEECTMPDSPGVFCVKFGPPKVKPGKLYSVKIRAVNGAGPGKYCKPIIFRFKTGPPNQPKQPTVLVLSPTEVLITAKRLSERDENGSDVTRCIVEYTQDNMQSNEHTWQSLKSSIKQRSRMEIKLKIGSLEPNTIYRFRIKMVNGSGESAPSPPVSVETTQLIPGPPQDLRVSSKRTDTAIKLRWKQPTENPHAAYKYKVQIRLVREVNWTDCDTVVGKTSTKIIQLKSDTKYRFRVRSLNNKDEAGDWTSEVEIETRFGIFGRTLGTIGAFVGGTVGGPLLGAVGAGGMAGIAAGKHPDSETGKRVAQVAAAAGGAIPGALLSLIGAPVMGAMCAIRANKHLAGEIGDISPQTSDDEEETAVLTEMINNADKMVKNMMD